MAHERHRDGEVRDAIDEIGRAIDRIDAPEAVGTGQPLPGLVLLGHLFADDRQCLDGLKPGHQSALSGQIGFGEQAAVGLAPMGNLQVARHHFFEGDGAHCLAYLLQQAGFEQRRGCLHQQHCARATIGQTR